MGTETRGRFNGRVALITGGGTGIGAAIASRIVAEGGSVVLTGRRNGPITDVADYLGEHASAVAGDAADRSDAERIANTTIDRFGRLDVFVANAGGHRAGSALDTDDDAWRHNIHTNLDSAFVSVRASLPHLITARGSIVVVSSIAGLFAGPDVVGYVTAKHALVGLTRSLARDYGRHGVRVNALCPGWVRTPMADEQMDELGAKLGIGREEAYALVTRDTPLGRPAESDEIASVAAFLASDDASIMTGTVVVADAGAGCVDLPTLAFG